MQTWNVIWYWLILLPWSLKYTTDVYSLEFPFSKFFVWTISFKPWATPEKLHFKGKICGSDHLNERAWNETFHTCFFSDHSGNSYLSSVIRV